jgi:predicted nucleotide-binding protein (sugar kinase/HSP70/actin superfamily)
MDKQRDCYNKRRKITKEIVEQAIDKGLRKAKEYREWIRSRR